MSLLRTTCSRSAMFAIAFFVSLPGCMEQTTPRTDGTPASHNHAGHEHSAVGPHQGELIELGNEKYHAELVHDEQSVAVYILNAAADQQVGIEAAEIMMNAMDGGQPTQFKLTAVPDANDPPGRSSRFVSEDADLVGLVGREGVELRIVLAIEGKSYRGEVVHQHDDHANHSH